LHKIAAPIRDERRPLEFCGWSCRRAGRGARGTASISLHWPSSNGGQV